ncbi:MAG TPA: bacterioferritin [Armatimonadota bacterium]|nr:bacterioferritin [Armatimonadota bacterium]HPP75035.1 bacterioferritin [Armatimonadota bacterium]
MKEKVVGLLNEAREQELHAISQYMAQHYELEDQGYGKLGKQLKQIAITEMKHAEELAERILFLGGSPVTKPAGEVKKGLSIADLLKNDIQLESGAVKMYNDYAKLCAEEGDHISKGIFEKLLADEEEHLDDFQMTLDHVEKLGDVFITTLIE